MAQGQTATAATEQPERNAVRGAAKVCNHYFGQPQQQRNSPRVEKMLCHGDPRINIQNDRGKAKPCQVRQVLAAIEKLIGEER